MNASTLIRTTHGIETPAAGRWELPAGQVVATTTHAGLRRHQGVARVAGGALVLHEDPSTGSLELDLAGIDGVSCLRWSVTPGSHGRWRLHDGPPSVVTAWLHYQGVFRSGARVASVALSLQSRIDLGGRRRFVDLVADLVADSPGHLLAAA